MWGVGVVEAGVSRFDGVERAVKRGGFDANLTNEVLGEVRGEARGIGGGWVGKEGVVDEHRDGVLAVHCGVLCRFLLGELSFFGGECGYVDA